jgi:SAM-dependent methyltransferase
MKKSPLVEFSHPVAVPFRDRTVPAMRDEATGYVAFQAPPLAELNDHYVNVYGKDNPGYYSVEQSYSDRSGPNVASAVEATCRSFGITGPLTGHELGCSFGAVVAELNARGHSITGSDVNSTAINEARAVMKNTAIFSAANTAALDRLVGPLDVIYASHVLEHDPNMLDVVRRCAPLLAGGGLFIAYVPNAMYVRALLDGFISHPWTAYPDHLHMMSAGFIGTLAEETGFVPMAVSSGTSFEVDADYLGRHFSELAQGAHVRKVWLRLFELFGLGMELTFVLAPKGSPLPARFPEAVADAAAAIRFLRQAELRLRDVMAS